MNCPSKTINSNIFKVNFYDTAISNKRICTNKNEEDGKPYQDKSSKDYIGKAQVQYTNGDTFHWDFKDGVRDRERTYIYSETGNRYEGQWKDNLKSGIGKMTFGGDVNIMVILKMVKDALKMFINIYKLKIYILVLGKKD